MGEELLFTVVDMVGGLVYCAYKQDPYMCPSKIDVVIEKWVEMIRPDFKEFDSSSNSSLQTGRFSLEEIEKLISRLHEIPEFRDWNLSRAEIRKGISVDDPNRPPFAISSHYSCPSQEYDFIDLDALTRNVVRFLWDQARLPQKLSELEALAYIDPEHQFPDATFKVRCWEEATKYRIAEEQVKYLVGKLMRIVEVCGLFPDSSLARIRDICYEQLPSEEKAERR
jgi:hypothetical protein